MATTRSSLSQDTKRQIIEDIRAKRITIDEVVSKHHVQPYQVFAWIGSADYRDMHKDKPAEAGKAPASPDVNGASNTSINRVLSLTDAGFNPDQLDHELCAVIGEYFLKKLMHLKR